MISLVNKGFFGYIDNLKDNLCWRLNYTQIRSPKSMGVVPYNPKIQTEIVEDLKKYGFEFFDYEIDVRDYHEYLKKSDYSRFSYYHGGKAHNFVEKSLEHYLAFKLLGLSKGDIYIDIANGHSPAPDIYHSLCGCTTYKQDKIFSKGINGDLIGGDAGDMPLANGFASKIALHDSFQHFQGDADMRFIKEAQRVLKKGGKMCILPLYLFNRYAIQTDIMALPKGGIVFDKDAILYCAKDWKNIHGRFYDVPHLITRVVTKLKNLSLTLYVVKNIQEVDPSCYVRFIALFEKKNT